MNNDLLNFQKVLAKHEQTSAIDLAEKAKCSIPTVYRWIRALKQAGALIIEVKEPRKKTTGPTPRKFTLMRAAP